MNAVKSYVTLRLHAPMVDVDISFERESLQETAVVLENVIGKLQQAILKSSLPVCPIHGVFMMRHEKDGLVWWSHKLANGQWCNGRPSAGPTVQHKQPALKQPTADPKLEEQQDEDQPPF